MQWYEVLGIAAVMVVVLLVKTASYLFDRVEALLERRWKYNREIAAYNRESAKIAEKAEKEPVCGDGVHEQDVKWMLGNCAECGQTFAGLIPTVIYSLPGGLYTPKGTPFLCARCWCEKNPEPEEGNGDGAKKKPKPPHGGYPDVKPETKVEEAQKVAYENTVNPGLATTVQGVVGDPKPVDPQPKETDFATCCVNCKSTKNLIESLSRGKPTGIFYCKKCVTGLRK